MTPSSPLRRHALRGDTIRRRVVVLGAALISLISCSESSVGPAEPLTYSIVAGAFGEVVFAESIGVDSASAMAVIEARKAKLFGEGKVTLGLFPLEVVDEHGTPPRADFYAVHVRDANTELLVHSVAEVVTTDGDLFKLLWPPD
jgi:hypothetical protein